MISSDGKDDSLSSKLRQHYKHGFTNTPKTFSKIWFRFLFQFQSWSQLLMVLNYLTPFLLENFEPDQRYLFKVLFCYIFVMAQANWLSAICYKNHLPDFRDNPAPVGTWYEKPPQANNSFTSLHQQGAKEPWADRHGMWWRYCQVCQRYKPPRAHHCKVCKSCVLRRDHHCYLIGTCIGHYNQRYFVAFLFYCVVASLLGLLLTLRYFYYVSDCAAASWYDYLFPVAVYNWLMGSGCVDWQFVLLSFHCVMYCVFGPLAAIYMTGQLLLVVSGYTLYEVAKQVEMTVSTGWSDNMSLVFGDYWFTSFLFPSQIIFKQRNEGTEFEGVTYGLKDRSDSGKLNVE